MITVSVSEIKEFLRRSKHIKTNSLIPALGYIKMECVGETALFTKTNLNGFCVHEIPISTDKQVTILLDEKKLSAICQDTKSSEITINSDGEAISISDGQYISSYTSAKVSDFPEQQRSSENQKSITLNKDFLSALGIAKNFVDATKFNTNYSFVHVTNREGKFDIMGTNQNILFLKSFDMELPHLVLDIESCNILSQFDQLLYSSVDNYILFDAGKTKYGFIKNEYKSPQYGFIVDAEPESNGFIMQTERLIEFCERTINIAYASIPYSSIKDGGENRITLGYFSPDFEDKNEVSFEVEKNCVIPEFKFNPKVILPALKAIPYSVIHFKQTSANVYTLSSTEDTGFKGVLAGLNF